MASQRPLDCALTGTDLLNSGVFNKGSAFSPQERIDFDIAGLLPAGVQTLDEQVERAYEQYRTRHDDDLAKNTFLASLKNQNEILYYKLVSTHIKEMLSVIYTPTEGDAIKEYSKLFRRPEGCFLNIDAIDRVHHDLSLWGSPDDIDYIIVTDGEEILGIGDQGVGGGLISSAKGVVATLCAGIPPSRILPIGLDCGTDNDALLRDELYLGLRRRRVRGEQYDRFVGAFVGAARALFPCALIHFEDFGLGNARRLLDTYGPRMACFNDDVQGTGCVALAAVMAALRVAGTRLRDVRMLVFGAGSAGVGVADQVRNAIAEEGGVSRAEAARQIWLIDRPGLLASDTPVCEAQQPYAKDASLWPPGARDLLSVVSAVRPHVLVGTSTAAGAFTEDVVRAMDRGLCEGEGEGEGAGRPVILPLSNPTRLQEASPGDLLAWTGGRALVATGSPAAPVRGPRGGLVRVAECNNALVFPGICLGAVLSRAARLTEGMLVAAVRGLAEEGGEAVECSTRGVGEDGAPPLLPDVTRASEASVRVAAGVVRAAVEGDVAGREGIPRDEGPLRDWVRGAMWEPEYRPLRRSTGA
ncbi:NAD-dependent malic enzyme [Escovopsis weberi]|uniref:Malic enzyme n=1 Tax=Escovopsis weberi TaxID=150374 RepID=A0A0M9VSD7_ESCWE|nr:NAD-dependent malic enzyme [Escovopsis weberi]